MDAGKTVGHKDAFESVFYLTECTGKTTLIPDDKTVGHGDAINPDNQKIRSLEKINLCYLREAKATGGSALEVVLEADVVYELGLTLDAVQAQLSEDFPVASQVVLEAGSQVDAPAVGVGTYIAPVTIGKAHEGVQVEAGRDGAHIVQVDVEVQCGHILVLVAVDELGLEAKSFEQWGLQLDAEALLLVLEGVVVGEPHGQWRTLDGMGRHDGGDGNEQCGKESLSHVLYLGWLFPVPTYWHRLA